MVLLKMSAAGRPHDRAGWEAHGEQLDGHGEQRAPLGGLVRARRRGELAAEAADRLPRHLHLLPARRGQRPRAGGCAAAAAAAAAWGSVALSLQKQKHSIGKPGVE
jgi:hypothetical protein